MNHSLTALFFCLLVLAPVGHAQTAPAGPDTSTAGTSVSIAAPGGIVQWRDVAGAIAGAENLDEAAVADLFPGGSLNLNAVASRWIISGLSIGLGSSVDLAIEGDAGTANALRVTYDRGALRDAVNLLKGIARQIVFRWGAAQDSRYGLLLDEDWLQRTVGRPLIVIVHGYGSRPEEFDALRERLRAAGFACAVFAYPNDAAVAFSGRQMASALRELESRYPDRQVSLLAHSMGGLVSRVVVEDPGVVRIDAIKQLIMVATPNHGSNLARIPVSLDVWENWLDGEPDTVKSVFLDSVLDGLNEARADLQPDSELLMRLNGLPRNPAVRYSLLLGNQGPATQEEIEDLRRWILGRQNGNPVLRALGPRLGELLEDLDELVDQLGDGAVAVERGRLDGVDDTLVLGFRHGTITSALADPASQALVQQILMRLSAR